MKHLNGFGGYGGIVDLEPLDDAPEDFVYFDADGLVTSDKSKAVLKKSFTPTGWEITVVENSG